MGGCFTLGDGSNDLHRPSTLQLVAAKVMGRHYWFSAEKQCKALKDERLGTAEPLGKIPTKVANKE